MTNHHPSRKTYRASRSFTIYVFGMVLCALATSAFCILFSVAAISLAGRLTAAFLGSSVALGLCGLGTLLALFPGNLVGECPYAVEVHPEGVLLYAPFRRIFIPMEDIWRVRWTEQDELVIRLARRRLLRKIVINGSFGPQIDPLAQTIQQAFEHKLEPAVAISA